FKDILFDDAVVNDSARDQDPRAVATAVRFLTLRLPLWFWGNALAHFEDNPKDRCYKIEEGPCTIEFTRDHCVHVVIALLGITHGMTKHGRRWATFLDLARLSETPAR